MNAKKRQQTSPLKISVGSLEIGPMAKKLINQTLEKNRLTYGDLTIEFENKFARVHGRRYGIFTVSGTSALHVALDAMKKIHGWRDGDEVIVPAVTFVATANVVLLNNLKPMFVDVDPRTCNIDTAKIEAAVTKRTRAIMPVHLFGQPAQMDAVMRIAKKHGLRVLADSCETMLVNYKGKSVGAWGDIVCFSTYAAHLLVTGVGGLMLTDNPEYATKMRSLVNHGRDTIYYNIDQDDKLTSTQAIFKMVDRRFSFIDVGYSFRLTELEAAIGLEGLAKLSANVAARQKNGAYLLKKLKPFEKFLQLPVTLPGAQNAFMMFPIILRENVGISRADVVTFLEARGIETRYLMPLLNQPIYKKMFGSIEDKFPVAKWIDHNGFYIGCHQFLKRTDLDYVAKVFGELFAGRKSS